MTRRLYHLDAYRRECEARVTAVAGPAIALDETVFYPAVGGQPCDWGRLGGLPVRDVREEDGDVWHVLEETATAPPVGARVAGVLDWDRRFDHMQQHTGQHILSQAFAQTLGAQTDSVHMGTTCTLDLALAALNPEGIARAEDLANAVVMENRAVTTREVDVDDAQALGLRRPPKQKGLVRVVEVTGFDRSACGGTHVRATGEVGPIVVRGWQRYKGGARVEFLCGWRALRDYRRTHGLVQDLAGRLTVGEGELTDAVVRLGERARDLERDLDDARTRLLDHEAEGLLAAGLSATGFQEAAGPGSTPVVAAAFTGRSIDELRALARAVTARRACLAIFATEPDHRLVVTRSPALAIDASAILRETLSSFNGRGGGRPEAAEGIAAAAPSASAVVDAARAVAVRHLGPSRG